MIDRLAPSTPSTRQDWFAPTIVAGSLLLHLAIVIPLLWSPKAQAAHDPKEIPVELVQMSAKPTAKPAPDAKAQQPTQDKPTEQAKAGGEAKRSEVAERMERLIGPMRAMAIPSLARGDHPLDDTVSYRQVVLSQVARQKREDRHDGIPAHAVIAFTIGDHGEVLSCTVREKSVDPILDAEAVAMVYRGAPYPPPPPGAERAFSFGLAFRTI